MNERIREIAVKAGIISAEYNGFDSTSLTPAQTTFAELLIQECAYALNPMLRDMISRGQGVHLIYKHFGMEN
jgi:hypothetical protein